MDYNVTLNTQIKKLLPEQYLADENILAFLDSINKSYNSFERALKITEHAFNISEKEYQKINTVLTKSKELAENSTSAKSQYLSTMSHEIRTPLNAVIGFTQLLQQLDPRSDQVEYLSLLKFSSENLLVLINDILDLSKIEAGKIKLEEADFKITGLLNNIRLTLSQSANAKNIQLNLITDPHLPDMLIGDPVRLGQIFTNLISNAIKFTNEGSVTINASLLEKKEDHTLIDFEVADTGIGIAANNLELIFESFTQATADTTRKFGGTGLGLSISKKLLQLMDSEIKVKSEPGKGSVFYFRLRLKNSMAQPESQSEKVSPQEKANLAGLKILIVDDNKINVMLIKQFLKLWAVRSDEAANGKIAFKMVRKNDYDMILMDLQMPEMDGYESTIAIRNLPDAKFKDLPIIALTASVLHDVRDKVIETGMNDFIIKPFNQKELYQKILLHSSCSVSVKKNNL
nr:ATP-binding protein [Mucilaginibacter sp. SP1R1]MBB6152414.1 signal transduction histidine kinase/CheY-like chemotaxis protein [Mucilaginibacter sp. SP1R1]